MWRGKDRDLSLQEGASYTYTLRLGYSKIFILYQKEYIVKGIKIHLRIKFGYKLSCSLNLQLSLNKLAWLHILNLQHTHFYVLKIYIKFHANRYYLLFDP